MQKTILITGASSGRGKVACLYFAAKGWNVIAAMSKICNEKELAEHPFILIKKLDVTDITSIENTIIDGIDEFGGIDVVLNNEGCEKDELTEITTRKTPQKIGVNVSATMNVMRAILPHFRIRNAGTLVNVNPNVEQVTATIYEFSGGNMIKQRCFSDETFTDLRGYSGDYFDFLLD